MKKFLLFLLMILSSVSLFSQIVLLNENMDSYAVNSFLGNDNPTWFTTWSNLPGSGEDAQILSTYAHSGTKSASADLTGGQTDCVLKLGDKTTGSYELKWWMYIENGKSGYYNIQHFQAVGTEWAFEIYFRTDGAIHLYDGVYTINGTYPKATWFEVKHIIKLDVDSIYLYINNTLLNSWPFHWTSSGTTGSCQLGAVDLFAGEESGSGETPGFFFDDVSYSQIGTVVPTVTTLPATLITSGTATLNGTVNANIQSTTVTFEYGLTTAYGTTVPGVPATVTGNSPTSVLANLTGLLPGATYHFRVKGVNSVGTSNGSDQTFTTPAIAPAAVTTAATSVTSTGATLNGTVDAGGASTAVTFEYGLTTAYGTTVSGVPGNVTGNGPTGVSAAISGLTVNTTYHFRVKGANSVATTNGGDMTFLTTSCPMPGPAGAITGPSSACATSTGNIYSIAPVANATGYNWTIPAGWIITGGNNTNSITVTIGTASGSVTVAGFNSCGDGSTSSLPVTVNPAPVPTITGQTTMCVNSGYFYYSTQSGFSNYTWSISTGGTIVYGTGTSTVMVTWDNSGPQWIKVNYSNSNGCMAGTPTVLNVTVNGVPGAAGSVTGTPEVCSGATGNYTTPAITNAMTYVWTLPAGATIVSGAGTNSITVDWTGVSGIQNISVYGNNLCGNGAASPAFSVTVDPLPDAAGTITGTASVCQGETGVVYTVPAIANATGYTWSFPSGASVVSGGNTNEVTVDFSETASSGIVTVTGTNTCGNGQVSPDFALSVNPVPPAPVITINTNYELSSNAPSGNQWYRNGDIIPGATSQTYPLTLSGEYWDVVTLNSCPSDTSNHIYVVITGNEEMQRQTIKVWPNPNEGRFSIQVPSSETEYDISVIDNTGHAIMEIRGMKANGTVEKAIDLPKVPSGVYSLIIKTGNFVDVRKVVITR